jgi:hypothetical protein
MELIRRLCASKFVWRTLSLEGSNDRKIWIGEARFSSYGLASTASLPTISGLNQYISNSSFLSYYLLEELVQSNSTLSMSQVSHCSKSLPHLLQISLSKSATFISQRPPIPQEALLWIGIVLASFNEAELRVLTIADAIAVWACA